MLWDMKDGSRVRTVRFEAPVYIAELHPFNQYVNPHRVDPEDTNTLVVGYLLPLYSKTSPS